ARILTIRAFSYVKFAQSAKLSARICVYWDNNIRSTPTWASPLYRRPHSFCSDNFWRWPLGGSFSSVELVQWIPNPNPDIENRGPATSKGAGRVQAYSRQKIIKRVTMRRGHAASLRRDDSRSSWLVV